MLQLHGDARRCHGRGLFNGTISGVSFRNRFFYVLWRVWETIIDGMVPLRLLSGTSHAWPVGQFFKARNPLGSICTR